MYCWRSVPLPCGQYNGHFYYHYYPPTSFTIVQPTIACFFLWLVCTLCKLLLFAFYFCPTFHNSIVLQIIAKKTPNILFPFPFITSNAMGHSRCHKEMFTHSQFTCSDECGLFRDTIVFHTLMSIILWRECSEHVSIQLCQFTDLHVVGAKPG